MDASIPAFVNLSASYGATFIGVVLATALWGISCMQCFVYFMNYTKDNWVTKALVAFVWTVGTVHEILIVKGLYVVLISYYGDLPRLSYIQPELVWQVFPTGLMALASQLFFAHRLWLFSGRKWQFPAIIIPAALSHLVLDLVYIPETVNIVATTNLKVVSNLSIAANAIAGGVDVVIAVCMLYYLRKEHCPFKGTKRMVTYLMAFTVNSGLWTALIAVVVMITEGVLPNNIIFAAIYNMLAGLYGNTVLANLNAREFIRGSSTTVTVGSTGTSHRVPDSWPFNRARQTDATETSTLDIHLDTRKASMAYGPTDGLNDVKTLVTAC